MATPDESNTAERKPKIGTVTDIYQDGSDSDMDDVDLEREQLVSREIEQLDYEEHCLDTFNVLKQQLKTSGTDLLASCDCVDWLHFCNQVRQGNHLDDLE